MSVLVDTSVWIDHLRSGDETLKRLLDNEEVLGHPWVLGELSVGNLGNRSEILGFLSSLPQAEFATDLEVLRMIEREKLWGIGLGYIDIQMLAASRLSAASLWTRDRRLHAVATRFGNAFRG